MDLGLYIAASGMVADQTRQAQLSNDLANASTPGYKPEQSPQHSFGELLLSNTSTGQRIGAMNTGVQLGHGIVDMAPAGMQSTGQPLDFGIVGTGFFAVKTPQGVPLHPRRPVHHLRLRATGGRRRRPRPQPGRRPDHGRRRRHRAGRLARHLQRPRRRQAGRKPLHRHALRARCGNRALGGARGIRCQSRRARWSK